jgi:hypothetical protein
MTTTLTRTLICAGAAALVALTAQADTPKATPEKGTATLTMTVELKGSGVDRPASHERNVTWTVQNRYTVTATMTAAKPTGFGAMHKPDAAEQKREADRAAAGQAAAGNMQGMQAQAAKIAEMCGSDEACMQREVMKMARGIDPNSAEMKAARSNVAKASVMPEARYQLFMPGKQSATYAVKEVAHVALFDAACSLATETRCAVDTTVSGEGDVTDGAGAKSFQTGASAEIDYERGSLMLNLVVPGPAKVKKTVASRDPHATTGTTDTLRTVRVADVANAPIAVACGACQTASGKFEKDVTDELLGRPAKLVVTWSFKRS